MILISWHAGASSWFGLNNLNKYSIGIELDNAGKLIHHGSKWQAWFGGDYEGDEVIEATHKNETTLCGWHLFPPIQLEKALEVSMLLMAYYNLKDFLGHEDISPGRKSDPGPAFPMKSFQSRLLGRMDGEEIKYKTTVSLNIHIGPGTQHEPLKISPLPKDTKVVILHEQGSWFLVDVIGKVKGQMDIQGWVHRRYVTVA